MPTSLDLTQFNDHLQQAQALQKQVDEAQAAQEVYLTKARNELARIVKDKSIPLMDRWELFQDAPDSLKRHFSSLYTAKSKGLASVIQQQLEGGGRNTVFDASYILEGTEEDLRVNPNAHFWWDSSARVIDALEEVMANNIGTIHLSW